MRAWTHILTDCDGVLLDWSAGFRPWIEDRLGPPSGSPPRLHPNHAGEWVLAHYPVGGEAMVALIQEFQRSPAFGRLSPYPDAVEHVPALFREGIRLTIVSSPGAYPETLERRVENLRRCFGDVFEPFRHLPAQSSKATELRRHSPTLWLDDHVPHVREGLWAGHLGVHVDRFGEAHPDVPASVSDWYGVEALVSLGRRAA